MSDNYQRPSQPMRDAASEALNRKLPLRDRIVAWLMSKVTGLDGKTGGTAGGYWGGITVWDVLKAAATRATAGKAAAAAMFTRKP